MAWTLPPPGSYSFDRPGFERQEHLTNWYDQGEGSGDRFNFRVISMGCREEDHEVFDHLASTTAYLHRTNRLQFLNNAESTSHPDENPYANWGFAEAELA